MVPAGMASAAASESRRTCLTGTEARGAVGGHFEAQFDDREDVGEIEQDRSFAHGSRRDVHRCGRHQPVAGDMGRGVPLRLGFCRAGSEKGWASGIRRAIRDFGIGIVGVVTLGGGFRPREEFVGVRCRERAACGVALVGGWRCRHSCRPRGGRRCGRRCPLRRPRPRRWRASGRRWSRPRCGSSPFRLREKSTACFSPGERFARHGVVLTARRQEQRRSDDRKGYAVRHGLVVFIGSTLRAAAA